MKWLFGIALVMVLTHLYFRYGTRRLERRRLERERRERDGGDDLG